MQAHTSGPQVVANPTIKRHAKTIITVPAVFAVGDPGGASLNKNCPTEAKIIKHINCHNAAIYRDSLLLHRRAMYTPKNVAPTLTPPRIIAVTYEFLIPTPWKILVP
jgi:hypothetical protein